MFRNYLIVAFRHIWDQKLYSFIKIGGLGIGIAAFLLLAIFLQNEFSYDKFYPKKDRIYRVTTNYLKEGFAGVDFPAPFAKALQKDFPEVEKAGRYIPSPWFNQIRSIQSQQSFYEEGTAYVDVELLEILDIPLVQGDYSKSMTEPNTVLISESKAKKHFPYTDAIGQNLIFNNNTDNPYRVVGVFRDFPQNSHFDLHFLMTLKGVEFWPGEQDYWGANMYSVYALLKPGVNLDSFENKLQHITTDYFLPSWVEREFSNPTEIAENMQLGLQPIESIYLASRNIRDDLPHGDIQVLWLFGFSGILIILIACINFINLSTARYSLRTKEIGMRKVVGANRGNIMKQFLTESIIFCLIALAFGMALSSLLLPLVNQIAGKSLHFTTEMLRYVPVLVGLTVVLGVITGGYPAFYLSKLGGMSMQGPKMQAGGRKSLFRSSLVIFQFTISVILIICTMVVHEQMQFVMEKDLGFNKDQVVVVKGSDVLGKKIETFKEELLQISNVKSVSISDYLPVDEGRRYSDTFWKAGRQNKDQGVNAQIWQVDHDYIKTMGLKILHGRGFSKTYSTDSSGIVISRSLMEKLLLEEGLGTFVGTKERSWEVIGIIEDFHFESLKNEITPICLIIENSPSMISVKIGSADSDGVLSAIERKWEEFSPMTQFRYNFLDQSFADMHLEVSRTGRLFNVFAVLAIFIACLGLYSLTAFIADRSKREIGIRKVLGASILNITKLLSKDFIRLVLLSIVIAIPGGWYVMKNWLNNFAYRIDLSWPIFVKAALLALLIALATICYQSITAALQKPVNNLRVQ